LENKQERIIHSSLQVDHTRSFETKDEEHLREHSENDQPTHFSSTNFNELSILNVLTVGFCLKQTYFIAKEFKASLSYK
jgi:hypothetical protein